ncbi:MAG TPA: malectin domain-containing carbohydrate-binding protein [Polyangiaceae bacterium]|nr:malectin domain-containing carbohydrate-binding protein [Polyangiaceae bacterium]
MAPVYQINCGGPAVSPFAADQFASGGTAYASSNAVSVAGVANAAPAAVYQSERYGNQSYTFPNLTPNASYTVRLHFAEIFFTSSGMRQFNVSINGTQVLTNLDIFATVGSNKALVDDFTTTASASGQITVQYTSVIENAKASAIEVFSAGQSQAPANQAPTVASAATASPSTVTGTTTNLSVLGADDGGEAQLTYTWATAGSPPASVSFSANGTNAAKNTTATFSQPGNYSFVVTIQDAQGASTTSSVAVSVTQSASTSPSAVYQVNCGGAAVGTFAADEFASGGTPYSSSNSVSTAGVANAAPAAVYQTERYGNHSYAFGGLSASASYTVRLHFAEIYFTSAGAREFNVSINGVQVLTNFDIFATVGANTALVRDFTSTASSSGQIVVQYTSVVDNAKSSAIEIIPNSGSEPPPAPPPSSGSPAPSDVAVNLNDIRQRIDGFGASDKYATLSDAQADLLFSQSAGIGLSILRVAISPDATDISTYANAQKAAARGAIVWGSPWSPPAQWKDNGSTSNGGHLLTADYDAWATSLASFASTMAQNGVTLYGISAQNEPDYSADWDSCLYSSDQMIAFIKVLGPKLSALNPRPKLIAPEASNWGALWGYGDAILADSTASAYTDIIATHDYTYATPTHDAISKPIWETEVSSFDGPSTDIGNGLTVASWIHRALVTGQVSAWHYWWLIGQANDNEGLINAGNVPTKRLYVLGNYSKFVRPGSNMVGITGPVPSGVSVSAYFNAATGGIAIVAINANAADTALPLFVPGSHSSATPWVTSASDDLAAKSAIAISAGRFSAMLGAESVTTFVVP